MMNKVQQDNQKLIEQMIALCDTYAVEWAKYPNKTPLERTRGVVFTVLAMLDGSSPGFPMMDLMPVDDDDVRLIEGGELHHKYSEFRDNSEVQS